MPEPNPNDMPPGMRPSASTAASVLGGALATILILVLDKFHIDFPAGMESALAVVFTAGAGYIPRSGRS